VTAILEGAAPQVRSERPVSAPTDEELYWYLGAQQRWVAFVMALAFLVVGISLWQFSTRSPYLYPFLLFGAVNVVGAIAALSVDLRRRRIDRSDHWKLVSDWRPVARSVDIFLPTCGEDVAVLRNTYEHVAAIDWFGPVRIMVLDDAAREVVRELASEFGFEYVIRPNRGHMKKAGNLQHAYEVSGGDVVVIFDADFCPRADFLRHLMPYLDEESVGIVQSPQVFDTHSGMNWIQRCAGATQELFYRWVQPARDKAGAPVCVGTNALYRRAALDAIGGFPQIEHSEDIHTGYGMMRHGYTTRYVPLVLAKGLCPDDMAAFLNQQYRWANGTIGTSPIGATVGGFKPSWTQRLAMFAGYMYYLTTAVNVFAIPLPAIIMALFFPQEVRAANYVPLFAGLWVYFVLLPRAFRARWRPEVLRVQMAYSFSHVVAYMDRLLRREASWVPTGAVHGSNILARRIARVAFGWLSLVELAGVGAIVRDTYLYGAPRYWPLFVFAGFYLYIAVPMHIEAAKILRRERRIRREARRIGRDS
jgi:cellulose synthase (UDP-forming)